MAQSKPQKSPTSKGAKARSQKRDLDSPWAAVWRPRARRRVKVLAVLAVVGLLAWGGQAAWNRAAPSIVGRDRYLLPADAIAITPVPEWIAADVRAQVIHAAGLDRRLSVLDDGFAKAIENAFALHPWVKSVDRIEKSFPPAVQVSLTYRQPVAVIATPLGNAGQLLPVDERGVHLPALDVPLIRREHLPRLTNVVGQPPVGQPWDDPGVPGGVELAVRLAKVWEPWHLMEITPSARLEVQGDRQYFVYTIVTRGGTHINWGAAPQAAAPGEADFAVKFERLRKCVEQYGPLNTVEAPGTINVRGELEVSPRMVKEMPALDQPETVVR